MAHWLDRSRHDGSRREQCVFCRLIVGRHRHACACLHCTALHYTALHGRQIKSHARMSAGWSINMNNAVQLLRVALHAYPPCLVLLLAIRISALASMPYLPNPRVTSRVVASLLLTAYGWIPGDPWMDTQAMVIILMGHALVASSGLSRSTSSCPFATSRVKLLSQLR